MLHTYLLTYIHTYINFLMYSRISGWQAAAEAAALRLNAKIVGICIMYVCIMYITEMKSCSMPRNNFYVRLLYYTQHMSLH